ncbi:GntR family transcriptional regulator [Mesorhizobium sp. M7A.F.Ca.US.006.01.1.1]|uniref:GntR family transcriptional regulator n=1 Tax=Mesorhizobium sp. M7A.F.Ca.US.006.01.1.1 TaxID=2496707 RepID=UPI000FC9AD79|nr:GntR family transcriptional regulator [Mesorhizobium sp. M7A.F.Ca.US.006.01.1.1]RUZ77860.1 GntR family transcriptional regulator [Mesorhizobium sp. M7A.F.Ca.US.006.01.1.1]
MEPSLPRFQKAHGKSEAEIRRRILQAIFEMRLPPGERLTEEQLAETFDVSRTVVRQAIARLSQDGILVKIPNIGTTVAAPTRKETRDILAVRKMVEPAIVRILSAAPVGGGLERIHAHLARETTARAKGDRGTLVRLTGEFHLLLAEVAANDVLTRLMTSLQTLTCLAILLYAEQNEACPPDEHSRIVEAIAGGDGERAATEMLQHLQHVEFDLHLDRAEPGSPLSDTIAWLRGNAVG